MFELLKFYNGQITYKELLSMDKNMYNKLIDVMNKKRKSNKDILDDLKKDKKVYSNIIKYTISLDD